MGLRTQNSPFCLIGDTLADRPDPAEVQQGYTFTDLSTLSTYLLSIDPTSLARTWVLIATGGAPAGTFIRADGTVPFAANESMGGNRITDAADPVNPQDYVTLNFLDVGPVPNNPQFWVSPTGSDSAAGTLSNPLQTLNEAFRRLHKTGWTGQPIVTMLGGTFNLGSNPTLQIPSPSGNANPILVQGALTQALGSTAPTGGTAPAIGLVQQKLGTVTTALTPATNQYRGLILQFNSGTGRPLAGIRVPIHSNDNVGTFVVTDRMPSAPTNLDPFTILSYASIITYTGELSIQAPGGVFFDQVQINFDTLLNFAFGWSVFTGSRFLSSGSGLQQIYAEFGASLIIPSAFFPTFQVLPTPLPSAVVPCSCRIDGTTNATTPLVGSRVNVTSGFVFIGGASIGKCDIFGGNFASILIGGIGPVGFDGAGVVCANGKMIISTVVFTNMVKSTFASTGLFSFTVNSHVNIANCDISSVANTSTILFSQNTRITADNITGSCPSITGVAFQLLDGGQLWNLNGLMSVTNSTPGQDFQVDDQPPMSWADQNINKVQISGRAGSPILFAGGMNNGGGAATWFFGQTLPAVTGNSTSAFRNPNKTIRRLYFLRIHVLTNNLNQPTTFTVNKNNVASPITLNVPAASGDTVVQDATHYVQLADNDDYDLTATSTATAGSMTFTAELLTA